MSSDTPSSRKSSGHTQNWKNEPDSLSQNLPPVFVKKGIQIAVKKTFLQEKRTPFPIEIHFVSQKTIRKLKGRFLGKEKPTNVLSFRYELKGFGSFGEIFLSLSRIEEEASLYKIPKERWFLHLLLHGVLHLLGYDHSTPQEEKSMEKKEKKILRTLPPTLPRYLSPLFFTRGKNPPSILL
jgi:probable rRNA maturation factor